MKLNGAAEYVEGEGVEEGAATGVNEQGRRPRRRSEGGWRRPAEERAGGRE